MSDLGSYEVDNILIDLNIFFKYVLTHITLYVIIILSKEVNIMHMTSIKTDTYHIRDTYFVDIVHDDIAYEAYIYNEMYGIKQLMFGVDNIDTSYEEFLEMVETNAEQFINYYKEDHEDPEDEFIGGQYENNNIQS